MDYFSQQDRARSLSIRLIFLFVLAVLSIMGAVYLVAILVFFYKTQPEALRTGISFQWFDPHLFLVIGGVTSAVILVAFLTRTYALSKGGSVVAEALGGRLLNRNTQDGNERKVLNVVEEMAIASGVPVPQVYLLENEEGINAFAAGFSPNDAAIGVTKGCVRMLNRRELQGVIAHEFSHILNGDMRLNIRLIGGLAGIMAIANIGYYILRGSGRRSRGSNKKGGGGILLFALLLLMIGYLGVFFGRLIQSAISRQREYLADASAVQFTRDPSGIAGALKKIGGFAAGSKVGSPMAPEANHLFFGAAISAFFASHPPVAERIRRIDPSFAGKMEKVDMPAVDEREEARPFSGFTRPGAPGVSMDPESFMKGAGTLDPEILRRGGNILDAIPPELKDELGDILGASAIVCCLLLGKTQEERDRQYQGLNRMAPPPLIRQISLLEKRSGEMDPGLRLLLVDLAIPTLRMMTNEQLKILKQCMDALIHADKKVSLFELSVKSIVTHRLNAAFQAAGRRGRNKDIASLAPAIGDLLSFVAVAGHPQPKKAEQAFDTAMLGLPIKSGYGKFRKDATLKDMEKSLAQLADSSLGIKKILLEAVAHCVLSDREVTLHEAELLRAIAYSLDVPVPPFLSAKGK